MEISTSGYGNATTLISTSDTTTGIVPSIWKCVRNNCSTGKLVKL
jgi:hypothetical protein